ncbi:MAG: hypothetical protein ABIJ33_00185 [Patescibacteria group bacterium]
MKRLLTISLIFLVGFVVTMQLANWSPVLAQTAPSPPLPPGALPDDTADVYGFKFTEEEQASYFDAVQNCDTPSLECLVHHVTRFSAMEWIYNILGTEHRTSLGADAGSTGTPQVAQAGGGIIGGLGYLMGVMYANPVASSTTYVADVLNSAHIATPAYAQGLGFASLDPILPLWKNFRNLAYLFFVVIFIVIGFMIMFRSKIGGQTAVTAQQAIPQVVISLLFVTFSYAVAGLLIDAMYIVMILLLGIFGETFGEGNSNILSYNILNLFGVLWKAGPANIGRNMDIAGTFLEGFAGDTGAVGTVLGFLTGLMLTLLLAVAVLIGSVRLFFELLKSYASIVLSVVTSPIILMTGAIPGKNVFVPWVKDLIGNLLPFPTVLLVVIMFYQFTAMGSRTQGGFNPPFLLNNSDTGALSALMGLAIILSLPDIVKKIKEPLTNKGGLGLWLAETAGKNAKSYADTAENVIPAGTGLASGLRQAGSTGIRSRRAGRSWRHVMGDALQGTDIGGIRHEGFRGEKGGFARGAERGMKIRRTIDRAKEGRLWDPEDPTKLLQEIVQGKKKDDSAGAGGGASGAGGTGSAGGSASAS